jgi:predicted transcriptional regulator
MLATEIIEREIPQLRRDDIVAQGIDWMDDHKVAHLPVAEGRRFFGVISEDNLLNIDDASEPLSKHMSLLTRAYVFEDEHVFEVLKRVREYDLSLIPILDRKEHFKGVITVSHLLHTIAEMPVVKSPGSVIVMDMHPQDYTLTRIANILESEDAKILGVFISKSLENNMIEVTVKVNKLNVQGLLMALQRFGYSITASYDKSNSDDDFLDRYNNLMNYLNV